MFRPQHSELLAKLPDANATHLALSPFSNDKKRCDRTASAWIRPQAA